MIKIVKLAFAFYISLFILSACAGVSCKNLDSKACPILKNFQVFNKNTKIHFDHLCSDLDHASEFARQSYVFFEKSDSTEKALVLANLRLGWLGINQKQGLAVDFLEIKLESSWPQSTVSFALLAKSKSSGNNVQGLFVNKYLKSPDTEANYNLSTNGSLIWYDFPEPEDKKRANVRNHSTPASFITVDKLPSLTDEYQLYLIIKNQNTQKEILLEGSHVTNIESLLNIEKPKARVLGLSDTLKPSQKGGFWDWLSTGFKYDKCIYARKKARKEFDKRFNQL